jgi:endonuclease YncB( thermonuclease family)
VFLTVAVIVVLSVLGLLIWIVNEVLKGCLRIHKRLEPARRAAAKRVQERLAEGVREHQRQAALMKCIHPDVGGSDCFAEELNDASGLLRKMKTKNRLLVGLATGLGFVVLVLAFSTRHDANDKWAKDPVVQEPNATSKADLRLIGRAYVVDGDTIDINGIRIRLNGIDAPERKQTCVVNYFDRYDSKASPAECGQLAKIALHDFLGTRVVSCEETGTDHYRRLLATCRVDGTDLGEWMVSQGWAIAYRKYSVAYVQAEEKAHAEKRGIWAGTFLSPEQWRRTQGVRQ